MQRKIKFQSFVRSKCKGDSFNFSSNEVEVEVKNIPKPAVYPYISPQKLTFEENFDCGMQKDSSLCARFLPCLCILTLIDRYLLPKEEENRFDFPTTYFP